MRHYTIRKSARAKNLRITVKPDESVTVTLPRRVSLEKAEAFVREKESWIDNILKAFRSKQKSAYALPHATDLHYREHKERARRIAEERLAHFNRHYQTFWKRIAIKNTTSRWGSCSKLRNLNFSYRLAFLPPHLQDYLIVHELCHLIELNHSSRFWKLVAQTIPDHAACRHELRNIV